MASGYCDSKIFLIAQIQEQFRQLARQPKRCDRSGDRCSDQEAVDRLIIAYRRFGHLNAKINPLGYEAPVDPRLELNHYQLGPAANGPTIFNSRHCYRNHRQLCRKFIKHLREIYCGTIGIEYTRISDEEERAWLRDYMENRLPHLTFDPEIKRTILQKLNAADGLEKYLERKYTAQKRFSIEGADALIPMLDELAKRASAAGVHEMVIGMAHRGRLNVLLNIMGQAP